MFEFYLGQARLLASSGQLRLAWLKCSGCPIAFEYALAAKGSYHALKVGYDTEFAQFSPGQLLTGAVLQHYFHDPGGRHYDCMGPLNEAMQKWMPRRYSLGRLVIARPGLLGRLMLAAYRTCGTRVGRLLRIGSGINPK
jgi:CelD/BcsL family acetyltransferase involved in cellulose biosynthesis